MTSSSLSDSLRETLALFDAPGAPQTTVEVAEQLAIGRRSTYERLEGLVDHGELETKKAGTNGRVWWRPQPSPTERTVTAHDWPTVAESLVDDVLNDAAVGVFVLDEEFEVAWINDTVERYFGFDRTQVLGEDKRTLVREWIAPIVDDGASFTETVLATYEENTYAERFECRVTAAEGRDARWLEHRSKPIESGAYAGGRVELYYDISEQKRSERARREERTRFESLIDAVEEYAIFMLDASGRIRSWNAGAEQIKGYASDEVLGEHVSMFYTDEDRQAGVPEANLTAATEEGSMEDEGWRVRKDGSRFWAKVTITAFRDGDGDLIGYAKVIRDMTDRREHEREIRRENTLLERILEISPTEIGVFDSDGEPRRLNRHFTEYLELDEVGPEAYTLGDRPLLDGDGEVIPYLERPAARVLESGETVTNRHVRVDGPGGGTRWLSVNAAPLPDETGVVVTMADITQLEKQSQRLERQRDDLESELGEVFDRVDDAFCAVDDEFRFTYVNDRAEELLGHDEGELLGQTVWEALSVADDDPIHDRFETAMETQTATSFERLSDPLGIWEIVRLYPSESGLSVYFTDITERKERERKLEQYERIVETIWDGVYALDENERFVLVNEAFCDLVGYDRDELLGERPTLINDETVNETANELETEIVDGEREVGVLEYEFETADGETVPVETRFGPYEYGDGRIGRCGVSRDISERREYERKIEESNERLEQFAYGASHDLQEPLRMVSSYLGLIEDRYAEDLGEEGREFLEFAVDGADRMREMIGGLLEYSRVETRGAPFEPVDLNVVLDDVLADLQLPIRESGAAITAEELPTVEGDASQLRQVFQNLLANAIEYSGDEPPRVHVSAERSDERWTVSVRDEGAGIDPDDQERIFEVFQRLHTHAEHSGTGIGLALCRRIVERHDGEIRVDSESGEDATFSFTLPAGNEHEL
ncbi:PAS domain S-box protein [Natrialbaceae archaeon GCM10025810]|uniref:PAS domain-containing sensor histidine kinase n=1 Tax=Halovalidus salilacus TaxID=3075124 RepID=UPI0036128807